MGTSAFGVLVGHLGADPEIRRLDSGNEVIQWTMAVNRKRGRDDFTDWYRAVCFNPNIIDVADKYLKKGDLCQVTGQLQQSPWQDRDGNDRITFEVMVTQLTLLGDSGAGGGGRGGGERRDDPPRDRGDRGADRGRDGGRGGGRDERGGSGRDARAAGGRDDRGGGRDDRGGGRDDRGRGGGRDTRGGGRAAPADDIDDEVPF